MGGGYLGYQLQTCAVGCSAVGTQGLGPAWRGGPRPGPAFNPENQHIALRLGPKTYGAAGAVVLYGVDEQIVHCPPQQEGVCLQPGQRLLRQVHLKIKALRHAAVEKIRRHLPQKGLGL